MQETGGRSPIPVPIGPPVSPAPSGTRGLRPVIDRWAGRAVDLVWDERFHHGPRPVPLLQRWAQILFAAAGGFRQHSCSLRAAALSNTTLLSIVPILTVSLSVLTALGYTQDFALDIVDQLASKDAEPLAEWVLGFVDKARERQLGGVGAGALFLISISLVATIEGAMNSIWDVGKGRSYLRRATNYAGLLVLVPLGFAVVTYLTTVLIKPAQDAVSHNAVGVLIDFNQEFFLKLFRFGVVWFIFTFIYMFVPNTQVRRNAAAMGGLAGAALWQIAAVLYFYYSRKFTSPRYNQVYGAFAVVLISLVWVYISWCVLLFGAEISCASQNLIDRRRERRPLAETSEQKETLALRLAVLLSRPMLRPLGEPFVPVTIDMLSDELNVSTRSIRKMLGLFCREGLASRIEGESTYTLSRSPHALQAYDVLRLARQGTLRREEGAAGGLLDGAESAIRRALGGRGLSELAALPLDQIRTFHLEGEFTAAESRKSQSLA